ncbi:MAG TPA: DUF4861 family protein, partial [Puia sp.]|nr:DUF4861 family protein [Puia sp.]
SIASAGHQESLEWKNNIADREWAWCDALFMGPPALAYLYTTSGEIRYLDLADSLWWKTTDYLYDKDEHLYYRDSRYFTQRESNGKKMFWSRGNGWVMAGAVRMLENMPDTYPDRPRLIRLYRAMAAKIKSLQCADGTWHTSLLDSAAYPNKETSGTAFYCYAFAWGINHGLLRREEYLQTVSKAWSALAQSVHEDGMLGYVQKIGDRPGSTDMNSTQAYGVGAFLLAAKQIVMLSVASLRGFCLSLCNNIALDRNGEIVEIPATEIPKYIRAGDKAIKVRDALTNKELPFQWEFKGNPTPKNLLVQVNTKAGSRTILQIDFGSHAIFASRAYCRFVPERKDDFAWENDRIAFRMYGKALEKTNENGFGLDVWVKRTENLILDEWYKRGDYHIDHGDGLDCYHVGNSLGAGNIAPLINDSIWYSGNFHQYAILDNGPIRCTFVLRYDPWLAGDDSVAVSKIISLDAGSQLNRIQVEYSFQGGPDLPVAVGIVRRQKEGAEIFDEENGTMIYWEPQMGENGITGVASVFLKPAHAVLTKQHLLLISKTDAKQLTYFTGACWNKAGKFPTSDSWTKYISAFRLCKLHPMVVEVNSNRSD